MGLSSNQARFLSLTSRQVDLEQRIQQICQRRLRLSSELENVATSYNNSISNRQMFTASQTNSGIQSLTVNNLDALGYKVINATTKKLADAPIKPINQISESTASSQGYAIIHNASELVNQLNGGAATSGQKYILEGDIDLSTLGPQTSSVIQNTFQGTFDGNGYKISGLNINTSDASNVGLFSQLNGAIIKNVAIEDANVNAASATNIGILAGYVNNSTLDNTYTTGNISGYKVVAGIAGQIDSSTTSYCYSSANVTGNTSTGDYVGGLYGHMHNTTATNSYATGSLLGKWNMGGFTGSLEGGSMDQCYSTGSVTSTHTDVGGLVGGAWGDAKISNSYSLGAVSGLYNVGGLVGIAAGSGSGVQITNSYTSGTVTCSNSSVGGFVGKVDTSPGPVSINNSNFYQNIPSDATGSNAQIGLHTTGWDTVNTWDTSGSLPKLKNLESNGMNSSKLEEGLRNGTYSLAKIADEYSQNPITLNGDKYQEVDWRTAPEIYDELKNSDDSDAENKYDKTVDEINSQDKKLQLEQTSIETEYKAVASEKDAVKKILDTNATSSFKYFS